MHYKCTNPECSFRFIIMGGTKERTVCPECKSTAVVEEESMLQEEEESHDM